MTANFASLWNLRHLDAHHSNGHHVNLRPVNSTKLSFSPAQSDVSLLQLLPTCHPVMNLCCCTTAAWQTPPFSTRVARTANQLVSPTLSLLRPSIHRPTGAHQCVLKSLKDVGFARRSLRVTSRTRAVTRHVLAWLCTLVNPHHLASSSQVILRHRPNPCLSSGLSRMPKSSGRAPLLSCNSLLPLTVEFLPNEQKKTIWLENFQPTKVSNNSRKYSFPFYHSVFFSPSF